MTHLENLARSLTRFSDRLAALQSKEPAPEWADIVRDLENLEEAEVEVDGKRFRIRSEARGAAVQVFQPTEALEVAESRCRRWV